MAETPQFTLGFVFECPAKAADALTAEIESLLAKELGNGVHVSFAKQRGALTILLNGTEKWIDSSHGKIRKEICSKRPSIRTFDELGAELRRRAYDLIAPVEENLRSFINRAMTDVLGFSWWEELGEDKIREDVAGVQVKSASTELPNHPIEFTQFDHLVQIITGDLAHWKLDRQLSPADLLELISKASDLPALTKQLEERTTPRSIWDHVFARLFTDQESWKTAKDDLQKIVIRARHKVMHHRPMRLHELDELKASCARVVKTLDAKARVIKNNERNEIRKTANDLMGFLKVPDYRLFGLSNVDSLKMLSSSRVDVSNIARLADLKTVLRSIPDTSSYPTLLAKALMMQNSSSIFESAQKTLEESLKREASLNEQLDRLRHRFPFFETVPDSLEEESSHKGLAGEGKDSSDKFTDESEDSSDESTGENPE